MDILYLMPPLCRLLVPLEGWWEAELQGTVANFSVAAYQSLWRAFWEER